MDLQVHGLLTRISLSEGCNRLSEIVSNLPVGLQSSEILVNLLIRLDKKICNGVDDSDGTVGSFMRSVVNVLEEFVEHDLECKTSFKKLLEYETCFEWEVPLVNLYNS